MKLYRIRRIGDGKFFLAGSDRINKERTSGTGYRWLDSADFGTSGAFFKGENTIKRHLHNLCCEWKDTHESVYRNYTEISSGPYWKRLDNYEVETITIIDHGEKTQTAADFIGIKEELLS